MEARQGPTGREARAKRGGGCEAGGKAGSGDRGGDQGGGQRWDSGPSGVGVGSPGVFGGRAEAGAAPGAEQRCQYHLGRSEKGSEAATKALRNRSRKEPRAQTRARGVAGPGVPARGSGAPAGAKTGVPRAKGCPRWAARGRACSRGAGPRGRAAPAPAPWPCVPEAAAWLPFTPGPSPTPPAGSRAAAGLQKPGPSAASGSDICSGAESASAARRAAPERAEGRVRTGKCRAEPAGRKGQRAAPSSRRSCGRRALAARAWAGLPRAFDGGFLKSRGERTNKTWGRFRKTGPEIVVSAETPSEVRVARRLGRAG